MREYSGSLLWGVVSRLLGTKSRTEERTHTLSGGSDVILDENPLRLGWTIANMGGNTVFLRLTRMIGPGVGLPLPGGGGCVTVTWLEDGEGVGYSVIAEGVSGDILYIQEVIAIE